MHCDRCNVDFPEGLRYCKWCGEALVDRPRVTSELHSCPSCSAAIQPGWTFCKACGERLQGAGKTTGEGSAVSLAGNTPPDPGITCSSCGEQLDTGSLYCKGCGSAVYTEQRPFGGSALLCGSCKSYSPVGSRECRVCGNPFVQASKTVIDFPSGLSTVQQKAPTLADFDDQVTGQSPPAKPLEDAMLDSGANTITFTSGDKKPGGLPPREAVETNLLTGTAGARSEQQAPTQVMQMGRTTGPVETEDPQEAPKPSGDLASASTPASAKPGKDERSPAGERTVEFAAPSQPSEKPAGPTTLGLGSDSETEGAPEGSESKTAVFVSPPEGTPPASRDQVLTDDVATRPISTAQSPSSLEPTREFQQPKRPITSDKVAPTEQMTRPAKAARAEGPPPAVSERDQAGTSAQVASQPVPQKRTGVVIASVIVALILVAAAGYVAWLLFGRGTPPSPPPPVVVEQPPATPPPAPKPVPVVPEGMVAVTAGTYTIGRDGADPLEQPEHPVDLSAFYIDRSEVTNAAYKTFVDATGHKPPSNWTGREFPAGRGDYPVTGVTWQDAADYAAWAGKRLPTEAEWEAAARGTDGRIYPWGNGFRSGVANIGVRPDRPTPEEYPEGIKAAGRYPEGASPVGAVDMIGNAWEWVADEIKVYAGNTESTLDLEPGKTYRVIRGGAYDGNKVNDATYRGYLDGSLPYPKVGFRCAKDAK